MAGDSGDTHITSFYADNAKCWLSIS